VKLPCIGDGLADRISLGKRFFFLHDGRTSDLVSAIQEHSSNGSEANSVVRNFSKLKESQKQDLLNFLRSL
jgi:CxxC motif-containing protein (DUF1111 family)